jgi:RNA polymerase sigma-70 factor (ECF subfamily)
MESPGDRFVRLVRPLHPRVVAFARCLSRSRTDGDDLAQDALSRAFARLDTLRDEAAFRTWLFRIVVSVHRNRCRRAFWSRFVPFDSAPKADVGYRGDWVPDAPEATRRAREALAGLPAVQREAIVLFEIEGWLVDEIAAVQGVSASAVKSRLARGRARLRDHYEGRQTVPATEEAT